MANPIERAVPVYVAGSKIGEATEGDYDIDAGVTMEIADDETAFALGRVTCKMNITTIIPVSGMKTNLFGMVIAQQQASCQLYINGAFMTFNGIMTGCSSKWNQAKGTCSGSWNFIGATPAQQ